MRLGFWQLRSGGACVLNDRQSDRSVGAGERGVVCMVLSADAVSSSLSLHVTLLLSGLVALSVAMHDTRVMTVVVMMMMMRVGCAAFVVL